MPPAILPAKNPQTRLENLALLLEIDLLVFGNRTAFRRRLRKALQEVAPKDKIKPCELD